MRHKVRRSFFLWNQKKLNFLPIFTSPMIYRKEVKILYMEKVVIESMNLVKELTNVNDESRIVVNDIGWTSRVYIIDDGDLVFKFIKSEKYQDELEHETNILRLIKSYEFNVNIPLISWIGEDNEFIGFQGVKGKSLTTEIVNGLSNEEKRRVGTQIGIFLKRLHAIGYKGKSPNSEKDIIEWLLESFYKRKPNLKQYFYENELESIEKYVANFPEKSAKYGIEEVFCHGDLGYNNIVISNNLEVGIIDFGDAGNLDKSYDFIGLEDDVLLEAAISAYGGDNILSKKIAIRRQLSPLMEMLFLMERKETEEIEKRAVKIRERLTSSASRKIMP
jgi:tRNA A-37 threonylcarbamoyl transferase component Bud32